MKNLFLSFAIVGVTIPGCGSIMQLTADEESSLIHVECRSEHTVHQSVLQLFRSIKAKDIKITEDGFSENIEAVYMGKPDDKLFQAEADLKVLPGVMYVQVKKNQSPVRQPF